MKRLVGGDYLLDLSSIELEESEDGSTKTNITDADVLAQLTNLKKYVKNPEMAKPVLVKLLNGENDELVIARGTFAVVDTGEFEICVQLDGYKLVIFIEFTQVTLDDNTPIDDWYIAENDAKYLFTSDAQNIGAISELPVFENIVDAQGNKRFIEGDITIEEISGITQTYGKWSLSGSHLLVVLCVAIANATECDGTIASLNIPEWVKDKIIPQFATVVDVKEVKAYNTTDATSQALTYVLRKDTSKNVYITISSFTATKDRVARLSFDLLIDNE